MIIIKKQTIFSLLFILGILFSFGVIITKTYATKTNETFHIYIDPGHGGFDGGCEDKLKTVMEKDITLNISLLLASYLRSTGYIVNLTRNTDTALANTKKDDIYKRVKLINDSNADIYISIHANSYPSPIVKGAQVFYSNTNNNNKLISEVMMKKIKMVDSLNKREPLCIKDKYLLDHVNITGCLVEVGFLTNEIELLNLTNNEYISDLVKCMYLGIVEYLDYLKR